MAVKLKQTMTWTCDACGEKHQDNLEVAFGQPWNEALAPEHWHAVQKSNGGWLFFCHRHTLVLQASTKTHPLIFELKKGLRKYGPAGKEE